MQTITRSFIKDDFFPKADQLRSFYNDQFSEPREAHELRFAWDHWVVKNQYDLVRTPAQSYFPKELFDSFTDSLIEWGQKNLGCQQISPPWLSYYIDGCYQNWHGDVPHGPWAYVYSLCPQEIKFSGGNTLLLNEKVLNYWDHINEFDGLEHDEIFESFSPDFNRLIIFDPRVPHAVEKVLGVRDPRDARLVIHGWFSEPSPVFYGEIVEELAVGAINLALDNWQSQLPETILINGFASFNLTINNEFKIDLLTNTLKLNHSVSSDELLYELQQELIQAFLPLQGKMNGSITLPLMLTTSK